MTGRRLLITGAAGFTGRHAVNYFSAAGDEVTAVVRCAANDASTAASGAGSATFPDNVQVYICDLSDRQAVARMIKDVAPEEVLHLAGKNSVPESWNNPLLYMETNVMATLYLLEAMRSLPASRILVAGSRLKYRPGLAAGPPHPYSLSKTLEELISLAWGTLFAQPVLLAEPCNLIGPGPSTGFCSLLAQHIVRSEAVDVPDSSTDPVTSTMPPFRLSSRYALRDFLDVRDCIRAYDYILRKGENGTIYRIDSGTQRQLGDIAEKLLNLSAAAVPMDWGQDPVIQQELNQGQPKPVVTPAATPEADVSALGWRPEIRLAQSLTDIMDYYRASRKGRLI